MFEKTEQIVNLIGKHFRGELTPEEAATFEEWLSADEENRQLLTQLTDENAMVAELKDYADSAKPGLWEKVQSRIHDGIPVNTNNWQVILRKIITVAACLLIVFLIAVGVFKWYNSSHKPGKEQNVVVTKPVPRKALTGQPANKAVLELATGEKIVLHEKGDGPIESQGAFKVYTTGNDLHYEPNGNIDSKETLYNTISTPRGGHYRIVFPDGSTIAMNVATSVKFKVSSAGLIRDVVIKGEADFDITSNPDHPFIVTILPGINHGASGRVEVAGTRFNISAYEDAAVKKITLLNGNLKVVALGPQAPELITTAQVPGGIGIDLAKSDQAQIRDNGTISVIHNVDTTTVVSWKNGLVPFKKTPTREALSIIEKWFDVDVVYETKNVPEFPFTGDIVPGMSIETVINVMQFQCDDLHLKFDRTKKRLTVLP